MKRVAVLGGGPAGAFTAERLAGAGLETIIIDEKLAWEKPCGGGLTFRAYSKYPFLIENATPKRLVTQTRLESQTVGEAKLSLTKPMVIYSRYELNGMLLSRAKGAGAGVEKARVASIERRGKGWLVKTPSFDLDADFCIIAMGARNPLRELGTQWAAGDTMTALGYYVPASRDHIDIRFFPQFEGYIWVFPRDGHLSVGICGKGESGRQMRTRLESYMCEKDLPVHGSTFYGHVLPSLERRSWTSNRVAGEGWMAVGDSAGLVDPITGEGLYYAVRSADLAAKALLENGPQTHHYRELLRRDFTEDLELAARLAKRVFMGQFLFSDVPSRMIQFMRSSPTFCDLMQDLFTGTQNYIDLRERLLRNVRGTLTEVFMNRCFGKLVPRRAMT